MNLYLYHILARIWLDLSYICMLYHVRERSNRPLTHIFRSYDVFL